MATDQTLEVVREYHEAWSNGQFAQAANLLSERLAVEVPINDYPDAGSFAAALASFGSIARGVDLISELATGDEAMLLYDMDVDGVGPMRVAEHFTVRGGKIVRIRQIHDTAALRAAGFVA
jgi:ketosteroid isomerase-like protein